ncbi:hypothetical protein F4801DRAFT_598034 [Xylaria longipes]|nr:hypothetical protein F4801DRAFT_598034 [Xylaria longipes]
MLNSSDGIYYCNRQCVLLDYPNRKPALIKDIYDPFNRLKRCDYLQGRPDTNVFKILIDAYRLRMSNNNTFNGVFQDYNNPGKFNDFHRFLDRAKAIPPGWSSPTATINWVNVGIHYNPPKHYAARKHHTDDARKYYDDIAREHHYDTYMDCQLHLLAEDIYGGSIGDTGDRLLREQIMKRNDDELAEITETGKVLRTVLWGDGVRRLCIFFTSLPIDFTDGVFSI